MAADGARIPSGPREGHRANHDLLAWMGAQFAEFGDSFKASIYGTDAFVTRDPGHAQHVLVKNPQNYVKGRLIKRVALLLGNGLMASEGELWKRQRRMIQPAFHRKAVAGLVGPMAAVHRGLRENWQCAAAHGETVNLTRDLGHAVLAAVLRSIFGEDYDAAAPHFAILAEEAGRSMAFAQAFRALGRIVLDIVAQRRARSANGNDLLGMLLEARGRDHGEAMSERQLLNEIMTLIVAGHETTATTLNWAWYLISRHPEVEARLEQEIERYSADECTPLEDLPRLTYMRQVIEETLRLYPAGWLLTRRALRDDRLGDYAVAAGTEVYISPYFIQRHPGLWPDPERFDPDRFAEGPAAARPPLAMLPFSAGPRNCIGEHFARLQMQIHLMTIAGRLRLPVVSTGPVELDAGVNLRSRHDFTAVPQRREPAAAPPPMR
jgi:cytochrome P450